MHPFWLRNAMFDLRRIYLKEVCMQDTDIIFIFIALYFCKLNYTLSIEFYPEVLY